MRVIDADFLFNVLHDRMKAAEEWIERAETDEMRSRAEGFLSALIEIKLSVEDDVTTLKRGRWIGTGRTSVTCSECGEWTEVAGNYCPNCGAEMEEARAHD